MKKLKVRARYLFDGKITDCDIPNLTFFLNSDETSLLFKFGFYQQNTTPDYPVMFYLHNPANR